MRVEDKFSWDGVAHQLSDLYTKLLAEPAKAEPAKAEPAKVKVLNQASA
jgi:hypothetical protein